MRVLLAVLSTLTFAICHAAGARYEQARWGLSFATPAQWMVNDRGTLLLLGSNSEPGLMVVRFLRKTDAAKLRAGYAEGLNEDGLSLAPTIALQSIELGKLHALAGELGGMSQDGQRVRARIIGVLTPYGDAAVVMGITATEKYARLKATTDALAASLAFRKPTLPAAQEFLAGRYWAFSGNSGYSGSYSSEAKIALCADGSFRSGSETSSSGSAGAAGIQHGAGGRWSAVGDELQGTVTVTYANGRSERYPYVTSTDPKDRSGYGPAVSFGGRKYQRTGDGSCR
jgi:hypothetical protein